MANKKKSKKNAPQTQTGVITKPGDKSTSGDFSVDASKSKTKTQKQPQQEQQQQTGVGKAFTRIVNILGSLQVAIILLILFALSLIEATLLESNFSARVSKQLVYGTWWFTTLLVLLGVTILAVTLKKMDLQRLSQGYWPWKKYQTGFLVTHLGLITLVFGGLLTNIGGLEGQMTLADTSDRQLQNRVGAPQERSTLPVDDAFVLKVSRLKPPQDKKAQQQAMLLLQARQQGQLGNFVHIIEELGDTKRLAFNPGALPWRDTEEFKSNRPWHVRFLQKLANPTTGFTGSLGENGEVHITDYWPETVIAPYRKPQGEQEKKMSFPALRLEMRSALYLQPAGYWVTTAPKDLPKDKEALAEFLQGYIRQVKDISPAYTHQYVRNGDDLLVEMLHAVNDEQVKEFLNPPDLRELNEETIGEHGQLVVYLDKDGTRKRYVVPVSEKLLDNEKGMPLSDSGWTIKLLEQGNLLEMDGIADMLDKKDKEMSFPMVRFELSRDDITREYLSCARLPNIPVYQGSKDNPDNVVAWYHSPNGFWERSHAKGAVHLLYGPDQQLHYRSFDQCGYPLGKGEKVRTGKDQINVLPWRNAFQSSFKVTDIYPEAYAELTFKPVNPARIGAQPPRKANGQSLLWTPALRGHINFEGKTLPFSYRIGEDPAIVGKEGLNTVFFVWLERSSYQLDYTVRLKRAIERKDPGSSRSAEFKSIISVKDKGAPTESKHQLYMNHTLDHGGFRLFQANFEATGVFDEDQKRFVNLSGIQFARDPGLYVKYAGTFLVTLGIVIMFYMKAYFFRSRGKRPKEQQEIANDLEAELPTEKLV